jgi:hypothetical protein
MATTVQIGGSGALFVGEDKTFTLETLDSSDIPVNMLGWTVLFDVRKSDKAPDPAIFSKSATIVGVFNVVRATNTQRAQVTLSDTEMNTVSGRTYRYSWKRMDDGVETVLARGPFVVEKATAP